MRQAASSSEVIYFGPFTLDLRTQELRRSGLPIRLPGPSFQVLEALLSRPGELFTREELQKKLWPAEGFGDFEHGLNAAVNRVRDALSDHAESPLYIETLPRRGYRFIGKVEQPIVDEASAVGTIEAELSPLLQLRGNLVQPRSSTVEAKVLLRAAAVFIVIATAVLLFVGRKQSADHSSSSSEAVSVVPLTTLPGSEIFPSLSPDGSQVAFGWDGGHGESTNRFDLYVKVIGAERVERLTHEPASDLIAAWSPDGATIAFTREIRIGTVSNVGLFVIPARGGPERKLAGYSHSDSVLTAGLSWSPDGSELFYTYDWKIRIVTLATGSVRDFPVPASCRRPFAPAISPDGATVVVGCYNAEAITDFYTLPRVGGEATFLFRPAKVTVSLAWSKDGKRLIFGNGALFEISRKGGAPKRLPFGEGGGGPALALHADRLAYVTGSGTVGIWRVDLRGSNASARSVLAPTTREQRQPAIAPDGRRIAFESERSGYHEVWVANVDGTDAVQLTHFRQRGGTGSPKWSPNGQEIAFDSRVSGRPALYLVDPSTASPRLLSIADLEPSVPTWSRDGRWIYFRSGNAARPGVYKIAREGGLPLRITTVDGLNPLESADGNLLYFVDPLGEVHVRSLITGEEHPLFGMPKLQAPTDWVLTAEGLFFINVNKPEPSASIDFFENASAKITRSISLEKPPAYFGGLSLSPDGTWLAYSQIDGETSDLMLAEGFR